MGSIPSAPTIKMTTGKWNHSKKPSEYEVYKDGVLVFSGPFKEADEYMNRKKNLKKACDFVQNILKYIFKQLRKVRKCYK